ncbi:uncharacterized protein LOC129763370 [Toxorhynchites rutilus septentrionalis]|uniref:uncharacterized protein LOC129763370 n=1 Tax=Toxorhynchites rutilus septentrionalis TaxID=329112 RepID=UPI00247A9C21|nr:uncharacterized protein LOC129763370 [Toxorhynchites rutilus septentrionalis]
MKFTLIIAAVLVGLASGCVRDDSDGRPNCIAVELEQRLWRNNADPTAFWECETLNVPATARRCASEEMFYVVPLRCVPHTEWEWTPTCKPPSMVSS